MYSFSLNAHHEAPKRRTMNNGLSGAEQETPAEKGQRSAFGAGDGRGRWGAKFVG